MNAWHCGASLSSAGAGAVSQPCGGHCLSSHCQVLIHCNLHGFSVLASQQHVYLLWVVVTGWYACVLAGQYMQVHARVCLACAKWCTVQTYKCTFCSAITPGGLAPINHWTAELKCNDTVRWQQRWCTYQLTYCPASTLRGLAPTNHWTTELKCNDTG